MSAPVTWELGPPPQVSNSADSCAVEQAQSSACHGLS